MADALAHLKGRAVVKVTGDGIAVTAKGADILTFYANTIAHHFKEMPVMETELSAVAE